MSDKIKSLQSNCQIKIA